MQQHCRKRHFRLTRRFVTDTPTLNSQFPGTAKLIAMHLVNLLAQLETTTETQPLRGFLEVIAQTFWLLLVLITPFVIFALLIHFLERLVQTRLASRFGWKAVLWTGWLGTPIHELSHWVLCKAFRHKVLEMALFEPDIRSGRLGFVRHSWKSGNWFQEVGNFFIGLAPLVGGSLVLAGLLWFFYPDAVVNMISSSGIGTEAESLEQASFVNMVFASVWSLLSDLMAPGNFFSWRFWLFTYLVLCVGSHMAPSRSDYDGASRGVSMVLLGMVVCLLLISLLGFETDRVVQAMLQFMSPVFGLQVIAIVIGAIATLVVWVLTHFFPERFEVA